MRAFPLTRKKSSINNLQMPPITVLAVDDYEPFRRLLCSMVHEESHFQIVGEASDGLEAVHMAEELRPDVILIDIRLPKMNGFHAMRRILRTVPECKIVFLTQENSADVVQEAFRLGASGYVTKVMAGTELIKALEAVSKGQQFVSADIHEITTSPEHVRMARPTKI
jgi:DNA-binding NarL/FixJ family response regulator